MTENYKLTLSQTDNLEQQDAYGGEELQQGTTKIDKVQQRILQRLDWPGLR